jgi:hypothetical protein
MDQGGIVGAFEGRHSDSVDASHTGYEGGGMMAGEVDAAITPDG